MLGRVYAQKGNEEGGWVCNCDPFNLLQPKSKDDVILSHDINKACVFDVDNVNGFKLINGLIADGYIVCIGPNIIHRKEAEPSASPFTEIR